ncbi:MAG TPA: HK97-gp10 family putative phage morphogenesis protein [Vicinamibacterales bacterium]|nr:HK97-gp10 family putative phage morphogenesis protein [Vicinamibacterales bacterium]
MPVQLSGQSRGGAQGRSSVVFVDGIPELREALRNATPEVKAAVRKVAIEAAESIAIRAVNHVIANPSIKTGALKDSIEARPWKDDGAGAVVTVIGTPRLYAHLVEFGTRHSAAEPFLFPAAEAERGPYLAKLLAAGGAIERAVGQASSRVVKGSALGVKGAGGLL